MWVRCDYTTIIDDMSDQRQSDQEELGLIEKIVSVWMSSRVASVLSSEPEQAATYPPSWYCNGTMRHEARETIHSQTEWLREIDSKAMKTLRFNTLILGLILPTFSFAVKYNFISETADLQNRDMMYGMVFLISSATLSGITYTSSKINAGISAKDIKTAQQEGLVGKGVHDSLLASYQTWIESNSRTIFWNTFLITFTILLMTYALVFLSLGTVTALFGSVSNSMRTFAYAGLVIVTVISIVF